MNLTEEPVIVNWPETFYVFIERTGPFQTNAPQAWQAAHACLPELLRLNRVTGYLSLYNVGSAIYRAGFALDAAPSELPAGLEYELFPGGKYAKFVLTGSYSNLPRASGRVFALVAEKGIATREGFNIEHYANDPRVTPEDELVTEILIPTV